MRRHYHGRHRPVRGAYDVSREREAARDARPWTIDPAAGNVPAAARRPPPGIPADRRPGALPAAPLRLQRRHRRSHRALSRCPGLRRRGIRHALLKHDLRHGTRRKRTFGPAPPPARPCSSPPSPIAPEDDGYVLAFVHAPDRGAADLVILAAQDFTGEPVARVHLPARIPLGSTAAGSPTHSVGHLRRPTASDVERRRPPEPRRRTCPLIAGEAAARGSSLGDARTRMVEPARRSPSPPATARASPRQRRAVVSVPLAGSAGRGVPGVAGLDCASTTAWTRLRRPSFARIRPT